MKRCRLFPILGLLALPATPTRAAAISWQTPTNETGLASDISNVGTYFDSATAGSTAAVGGVTFNGETGFSGGVLSFGASSNIHVSSVQSPYSGGFSAPATRDAGYKTLVAGGAFNRATSPEFVTPGGLSIGRTYTIQIFEAFWNGNWATAFSDGVHASGNVNLTGGDEGAGASSVPAYVIGTFTADAARPLICWTYSRTARRCVPRSLNRIRTTQV